MPTVMKIRLNLLKICIEYCRLFFPDMVYNGNDRWRSLIALSSVRPRANCTVHSHSVSDFARRTMCRRVGWGLHRPAGSTIDAANNFLHCSLSTAMSLAAILSFQITFERRNTRISRSTAVVANEASLCLRRLKYLMNVLYIQLYLPKGSR